MKSLVLIFLLVFTNSVFAKIEISDMQFKQGSGRGSVVIDYSGQLIGEPELLVSGNTIQVIVPNAKVSKPIQKSVSFSSVLKDTDLKAYQSTSKVSKIKVNFAFNVAKKKDLVYLTLRDNRIELSFPQIKVKLKTAPKYTSITSKKTNTPKVKKEFLNEAYLNNLLTVSGKKTPSKHNDKPTIIKAKKLDTVKTRAAATQMNKKAKSEKSNVSVVEYMGKFAAFLGAVLLLFYGIVTLMKKGFIKKGKLGFLNNADQVSVISTTYIAPKKSLMMIKAHNQVFLVSNTDAGIHPISEIKDVAGLFKEGEKALSGHNFDTKFDIAENDEKNDDNVKIKKDIMISNKNSAKVSYEKVKEKVSFSSQLKKKVKNLKPLQ